MTDGRLDVADHLLRALEVLAPGTAPGSPLADAYRAVGEPQTVSSGRSAPASGPVAPDEVAPAAQPRRARISPAARASAGARSRPR